MPSVKVKDKESFERLMSRFKKSVERAGVLVEVKKREYYEKPTTKRRRLKNSAKRRAYFKGLQENKTRDY